MLLILVVRHVYNFFFKLAWRYTLTFCMKVHNTVKPASSVLCPAVTWPIWTLLFGMDWF